jgi:hypothetical protein
MRNWTALFPLALFIVSGCGAVSATVGAAGSLFDEDEDPKSQLALRQMQTREYDTTDTRMALKAMLNVLQDDNFMVEQVNVELGFFKARKTMETEDVNDKFWGTFWHGSDAEWVKHSVIDCTASVTPFGKKIRIRASFQLKRMNNKGVVEEVEAVDNPDFYQAFFSKVSKGIFIEKEKV